MKLRNFSLLYLFIFIGTWTNAQYSISIQVPDSLLSFSEVKLAAEDVAKLLGQATEKVVEINPKNTTDIVLSITNEWSYAQKKIAKPYPVIQVPEHNYGWETVAKNGSIIHTLKTPSSYGIACGLYGLLQEALGFSFYHPREMFIPDLTNKWPLDENFTMQVSPKFQKKGFHLHTMHPIELAEPLFNPQLPGALDEVKEYIDWLARNEQNVFDFCLMESVDRKTWIKHAEAFTAYAKQRGIITSVDVSLHMIQQKSFQLYRNAPMSFRSKKKQIKRNLDWLFEAHWDIINMEFNSAEFLTGNAEKRSELRKFVQDETEKRGAKLMGRQHVVKESNDLVKSKTDGAQHLAVDSSRGVLAHTVMCYSMTEPHAPVYENENQRHIFEFMKRENKIRETWYYPESAYWVTFDNSVPVCPLPYLSARLADIDTAAAYDVEGHMTFSSGWEIGYWLFDWSIARWSKRVTINDQPIVNTPTQYLYGKPFNQGTGPIIDSLLALHEYYLKEKNLMAYMTAQTVTDEIPNAFRKEFHPRPPFTYGWLRNKANAQTIDSVEAYVVNMLNNFTSESSRYIGQLIDLQPRNASTFLNPYTTEPNQELFIALTITGLRAQHRALILEGLMSGRKGRGRHLQEGAKTRDYALSLFHKLHFRYDKNRITGKFPNGSSYTAYDFGYLYTAYNMHFWKREEQQAKKNRYDFLFMNIWEVFRIIGIQD